MNAKRSFVGLALLCATTGMQAGDGAVQLRRNQVGYGPQQEKIIVVEGTNPKGKLRLTAPDGRVSKPKTVRKAVSPWSGKTRYVVDLGQLTEVGQYQLSLGKEKCTVSVAEHKTRSSL